MFAFDRVDECARARRFDAARGRDQRDHLGAGVFAGRFADQLVDDHALRGVVVERVVGVHFPGHRGPEHDRDHEEHADPAEDATGAAVGQAREPAQQPRLGGRIRRLGGLERRRLARHRGTTINVLMPTQIVSPGRATVGSVIRCPLTNVPLVEPRSSISAPPSARAEAGVLAGQFGVLGERAGTLDATADHDRLAREREAPVRRICRRRPPAPGRGGLVGGGSGTAAYARGARLGRSLRPLVAAVSLSN